MSNIRVSLNERSYDIEIESRILSNFSLNDFVKYSKIAVITNNKINDLHGSILLHRLNKEYKNVFFILIEDGEEYKNLSTIEYIVGKLLKNQFDRKSLILAFGGGVVGDISGFVASIYMRGIEFIQIPTTLLAQVDSSVGGKTGVNHNLGKNMIGSFYQPKKVFIDIEVLKTLDQKQISAGLAEVIKYALIFDHDFFIYLENNIHKAFNFDKDFLEYIIQKSCQIKSNIVEEDESEQSVRALLNFGHTFAHAIESCQGYGVYLHGEAVAIGMILASQLSFEIGNITKEYLDRIIALIFKARLPIEKPANMSSSVFIDYMLRDKKSIDSSLRIILLKNIGKAYKSKYNIDDDHLLKILR